MSGPRKKKKKTDSKPKQKKKTSSSEWTHEISPFLMCDHFLDKNLDEMMNILTWRNI